MLSVVRGETTVCFASSGGRIKGATLTPEAVQRILSVGAEDQAVALGNCLQSNMNKYGFAF